MSQRPERLDPETAAFVADVCEHSARLAAGRSLDWPERRRIAELARAQWRTGGPEMARVESHVLDSRAGPLCVRLYRPTTAAAVAPVLVYLHGGGWCMFSIDTHDRLMREYADAAGVVVAGVEYCLAPEYPYPAAQDQCVETVQWLRREASRLGIDAQRMALGGDSAGANLALTTALRLRQGDGLGGLCALLLNYGAFDTRISDQAARTLGTEQDMLSRAEMDAFWEAYLGSRINERDPLAVPIDAALHGLPPTLLIYGERDVLAEQSVAMAAALQQAGVQVESRAYPGAPHSFIEAMSVSAQARGAVARGAAWMRSHLRPGREEGDCA